MAPIQSTSAQRRNWAPACTGPWAVVTLNGGARVSVRAAIVPAVKALNAVLIKYGYKATPPDCGAYNCRKITGGSGYSLHAFGIAIDINWQDNPWQNNDGSINTDMPKAMVAEIEALRTVSGHQIWRCGVNYTGAHVDPMHYEIVCTPAQLATGIKGGSGPVIPASQGKWVPFKRGDTAKTIVARGGKQFEILELQMLLTNIANHEGDPSLDPKGVDNGYGPNSQAAVRALKTKVNVERRKQGLKPFTVDDNVGPVTIQTARWINALI
jgi:peptidoglycan hydrolase-like protein with peptidoglycan-binding domain